MSIESMLIRNDDTMRETILAEGYDGLDVIVLSQPSVRNYQPESKDHEVCISIWCQSCYLPQPQLADKFADVLQLEFDDVDFDAGPTSPYKSFRDRQAMQSVEFFAKHLDKKRIVIHCYAGMSRSRSMAAALCESFQLPFKYYVFNKLVYGKVLHAAEQYHKLRAAE